MLNSSLLKFLLGLSSAYLFGICLSLKLPLRRKSRRSGLLFAGPKGSAAITAFSVKGTEDLGYEDGRKRLMVEYSKYADGKSRSTAAPRR